ncbi:hypothetical protein VTI74DRAFT_9303 [Chaetomium olivicolor]
MLLMALLSLNGSHSEALESEGFFTSSLPAPKSTPPPFSAHPSPLFPLQLHRPLLIPVFLQDPITAWPIASSPGFYALKLTATPAHSAREHTLALSATVPASTMGTPFMMCRA